MPIAKNPNGARTDAERRAHNKWEQANRVTLGVRMSKADGEAFRAWCAARGITVNAALASYVADCLRGEADGGAAPAAEIFQVAQPGQVLDGAALESAKVAAAAAGEALPAFVARAVRQVADADARERLRALRESARASAGIPSPEQTAPGNSGDLLPEQAGPKTPGD